MIEIIQKRDALSRGITTYFTGKPCKHGHISPRFINSVCVECGRLKKIEWYQKNKKRILSKNKTKYHENPAAFMAKQKPRNKEVKKAYDTNYRIEKIEKRRAWRRNRKARLKNADGIHTDVDIANILTTQQGKCNGCKQCLKSYHVDHVIPLIRGGSNWPSNLQILCPKCNLSKGAKMPDVWIREMNGAIAC
jgi:5-methylcytosine-specific restriction endonuclease McrA